MKFVLATLLLVVSVASTTQHPGYQVSVEARLSFVTGPDAKPPNTTYRRVLSDRKLYLFDTDPAVALEKAGVKLTRFESYGENHRRALLSEFLSSIEALPSRTGASQYLRDYYKLAAPVLKPHLLRSIVTDSAGKATFEKVPAGVYFLVGSARSPDAQVWNLQVKVDAALEVTLDNSNSYSGS